LEPPADRNEARRDRTEDVRPGAEPAAPARDAPYKKKPRPRRRILRRLAGTLLVLFALVIFATWPASITGIEIPYEREVQAGKVLRIHASVRYSSDWRRRPTGYVSTYDYHWSSSNEAVAKVSTDGTVSGIAPGRATITAGYRGWYDSTEITVLPWDVPAMQANVDGIKFFAGETAPDLKDRKYGTEFDSKSTQFVWAELTLDLPEGTARRALSASFAYILADSNNSIVDRYSFVTTAQREWPGVVRSLRLDFRGSPRQDRYRIEFSHEGKVIASAAFVVR
jgi:hypothetical protein